MAETRSESRRQAIGVGRPVRSCRRITEDEALAMQALSGGVEALGAGHAR